MPTKLKEWKLRIEVTSSRGLSAIPGLHIRRKRELMPQSCPLSSTGNMTNHFFLTHGLENKNAFLFKVKIQGITFKYSSSYQTFQLPMYLTNSSLRRACIKLLHFYTLIYVLVHEIIVLYSYITPNKTRSPYESS